MTYVYNRRGASYARGAPPPAHPHIIFFGILGMSPIWNQKVTEHKVWQISSVGHIPKTFHFSGPPCLEKAYFPK